MDTVPSTPDGPLGASSRTLHRFGEFVALTPSERDAIAGLADRPTALPRGTVIRAQGVEPTCIHLLVSGWASASVDLEDGSRQIVKIHLPGDLMGVPGLSLALTADTLTALTPVAVARIPLARFARIFAASPRFAMAMFLSAQRERVALMDALTRVGRTSSLERMAWLLLDLHARLGAAGLAGEAWFELMLRQDQIADVLGITNVHANRVFRRLEKDGLIRRNRQRIEIVDRRALARVAGWRRQTIAAEPKWLPWEAETPSVGGAAAPVGALHLRSDG